MYKNILNTRFKTDNPLIEIACVFDFPYLNTTKELVAKHYSFVVFNDPILKDIKTFMDCCLHGAEVAPFAFVEKPEEYEKQTGYISGELKDNHRGWWIYGYKSEYKENDNEHANRIWYPNITILENWIHYIVNTNNESVKYYFKDLFNLLISEIIRDRTKDFDERDISRRFELIFNNQPDYNRYGHNSENLLAGEYKNILNLAKNENIYKVMFDFYSK